MNLQFVEGIVGSFLKYVSRWIYNLIFLVPSICSDCICSKYPKFFNCNQIDPGLLRHLIEIFTTAGISRHVNLLTLDKDHEYKNGGAGAIDDDPPILGESTGITQQVLESCLP